MSEKKPEPEQRWDPFLKEWVIIAPHRGVRPILGKSFIKEEEKKWTCPFCPDAPEGSGTWVVKQLNNRFASLDENAPTFLDLKPGETYHSTSNYGKCEVILYTQDHNKSFGELTHSNIVALIQLWIERFNVLAQYKDIKFSYFMENRGKEIGVSMAHPHGQIYNFPYIPPKIEREFRAVKEYNKEKHSCLMCDIISREIMDHVRIIDENAHFISLIPYYAHWPYEIHIIPKRHFSSIAQCTPDEVEDLAKIMKMTVLRYDALRGDGQIMPYVMGMHNSPVKVADTELWHYHIEFYTPFRGKDRWKFLAGVELGCNTFINDSSPELNAKTLREIPIKIDDFSRM